MRQNVEWTFEGSFELMTDVIKVGTDGNHNRYLMAYMSVYDKEGYCQFEWYRGS